MAVLSTTPYGRISGQPNDNGKVSLHGCLVSPLQERFLHPFCPCVEQSIHEVFLSEVIDLIRNIHGVAAVAELDGDEVGYLVAKVAEIKRQS